MPPKEPREIPKASDLQSFNYAVAGHAGTLCDADGVLFIKPCVQAEIDFYEAAQDGHPELCDLMPLFMGTLMLNDATDARDIAEQLPAIADAIPPAVMEQIAEFGHHPSEQQQQTQQQQQKLQPQQQQQQPAPPPSPAPSPSQLRPQATSRRPSSIQSVEPPPAVDDVTWVPRGGKSIASDRAIVVENTTHGFKKPNILDVKLGHQRLWGDSAPLQKRQRMDAVCAETTHAQYGFRIAGMRVFRGATDASELNAEGYRVYDKNFGSKDVHGGNIVDAFRRFLFNPAAGIDDAHARAIAHAFRNDLERFRDVLERERTRMYSSSLLFVFEGDGDALRTAIAAGNARAQRQQERQQQRQQARQQRQEVRLQEARARHAANVPVVESATVCNEPASLLAPASAAIEHDRMQDRRRAGVVSPKTDLVTIRADSGISLEGHFDDRANFEPFNHEGSDHYSDMYDSDEDEASDDDDDDVPQIFSLRLIDFAHAKFVSPEDGPDENNLQGVRSLIQIFDELAS